MGFVAIQYLQQRRHSRYSIASRVNGRWIDHHEDAGAFILLQKDSGKGGSERIERAEMTHASEFKSQGGLNLIRGAFNRFFFNHSCEYTMPSQCSKKNPQIPNPMHAGQPLLVVFLFLGLDGGQGDTVQITLAALGDAAASLLLVLLEHADLLEGLHDLAVDGAAGVDVVRGPRAAVLGRAVHLAQAADADRLAEVDVAGDGGGAHVEPVDGLRGHLLGGAGLDGVDPAWEGKDVVSEGGCEREEGCYAMI